MPNQVYDYGGPGSAAVGRGGASQYGSADLLGTPAQQDQAAARNQQQQTFNDQLSMAGGLWNLSQLAAAPGQQNIYNQLGLLQKQADALQAGQTTQSGYLNTSLQNALAGLDLTGKQQDIQQGALNRQTAMLPQQRALQQQQYGLAGQQLGLQGRGLDVQQQQLGLQGQGLDVQQQGIQQQLADLYYGNNRANQNLMSGQAARGATNTVGTGLQQGDIQQQLQSGLAGINRGQQNLDLSRQQLGLQGQNLGISREQLGLQQQGLGIQQKQSDLSYDEQVAQQKDAQKALDIMTERTGLDRNEIQNRTQQALDQLGLSTTLSTFDIFKAMNDAQQGLYNPVSTIFGMLYKLTGLNPLSTFGG